MQDDRLDDLLARLAPSPPPERAVVAAADLAGSVRHNGPARIPDQIRRRPRRAALVSLAAGASLALTGAATLTAYQLSIPPFQTVPAGLQRASEPIPVLFEQTDGESTMCLLFAEFSHLSAEQIVGVDDLIRSRDWTIEEQAGVLGLTPEQLTEPRAELASDDALVSLHAFFATVIRGLQFRGFEDQDRPTFRGYGASCAAVGQ